MSIASVLRPALLLVALASAALVSPTVSGQTITSTASDGFNPNVDGTVYAVAVQANGRVLIAGKFGTLQPNGQSQAVARNNIARLLPDGRNDDTFNADVNGQIQALLIQGDGKVVIGGKFTAVNGVTRRRVARLNADGSLDTGFDPNIEPRDYNSNPDASLTPEVMALALQPDGKIVVGGGFKFVHPAGGTEVARNRIARFNPDGSLDATFDPNASAMVLSLAIQADGKILMGGGFKKLQPNGATTALEIKHFARLQANGAADAAFLPQPNNSVSAIELLPNANILIGGSFTAVTPNNGTETSVTRIAQLKSDGTLVESTTFSSSAGGTVAVLKRQPDGAILVGGSFSTLGGSTCLHFGRLLPSGTRDQSFYPGPNFAVNAAAVQSDGSVILAGGFTTMASRGTSSVVRNHVARVSATGALDNDFRPDVNGRLYSLTGLSGGKLLVGGSFTSIAGSTRQGVVRLNANGSLDTAFRADVSGTVSTAIELSDGKILIGGNFSQINGVRRVNLARLHSTGAVDEDFDPAPNGAVYAMLLQSDGKLLIGGAFSTLSPFKIADPVSQPYLARINADGTLDLTYKVQPGAAVYALAAQSDGKILLGGAFTAVLGNGATSFHYRNAVARLNTDGTVDADFNPNVNGTIYSLVVQPDGKIVLAGSFAQMLPNPPTDGSAAGDPVTRNNIARVNANGTLDETFNPNINGPVTKVLVQADSRIVVSGNFTALNPNNAGSGVMRNFVARLLPAGTLDDSFNLYLDTLIGNIVVGVALVENQKLVIAGTFAQLGSPAVARARLARVNSDGSVDTSFDSGVSKMGGATIEALTLQYGGDVLAVGDFATLNGATGSSMARFYADSSPDTTFVPSVNGPVHALVETPLKGTSVSTQHGGFAWLQPNGQLQSGFDLDDTIATLTSITRVVVRSDGKLLIAGALTLPDRTGDGKAESASLALLNPNGSLVPDSEFRLLTTGTIYAVVPLADGKTLIGGTFTTVDGASRSNFARLNADGSLDTSFTALTNSTVATIVIQPDGKILLGGEFTTVTPNGGTAVTRNGIARLNADGTLDTGFDLNPNAAVQAILVQGDGKILIGGAFTQFSKVVNNVTETTTRRYIARLNADGTLDTSIDVAANGYVRTMVQVNDKVILGGYFTSLYGETRNYLARVEAGTLALDRTFNPNPNSSVASIGVQADGKIVIGGLFTALEPGGSVYDATRATPRNRIARLNADGTLDGTFNPNLNSEVATVTVHPNGSILATGSFTTVQPFGSMMVGGQFTAVNGISASNLALFASDGSVSSAFLPNPNGAVHALLTDIDGSTIVGGAFTTIAGGTTRNHIARFTGENALDPGFNPNANGAVYTIVRQPDGKLLVGGEFTSIGGVSRDRIARLNADGSVDSSFSATIGGLSVNSIVLQPDGRVLVLASWSGIRGRLLRLQANGSVDSSFATVTSSSDSIYSIALQTDGRIVVGGGFTSIAGASRAYLARLNADGSYDPSLTSTPDGAVTAVTIQPDGKILLGGRFTKVDGLPRFGLARVATSTTGTAGNAFVSGDSGRTITWVRKGVGPEVASVYFESSDDLYEWVQIGNATRVPGTNNWQLSNVSLASGHVYIRASAIAPTSPNSSSGLIEAQGLLTTTTLPTITSATVVGSPSGTSFYYAIVATGDALTYSASGLPAGLTIDPATGVISGTPTQVGTYNVVLGATNASGTTTMNLTLIVGAAAGPKVEGTAVAAGANIRHPNGNTYDQFLLTGASANLRADPGEIVRVSFIDLDNDIVQVEFTGAGRFSVTLSGFSGPAAPTLYNQSSVNYMKGHATIAITGADETTHMTIFSVGTKTAVNQGLFRAGVTYDGVADIASVSIASTNGRFGSLRCANVAFFGDAGLTGVSAPGVQFASVLYVGDITAFGSATPTLAIGSAAAQTSIHGGDLDQDNDAAVTVSGLTQLKFIAGETSHGGPLAAQANKGVLKQNGVDVTAQIVVNPAQ